MLCRAKKSLLKALEPSNCAAAWVGPKMVKPAARKRSTTPRTNGASGPTMVKPTVATGQTPATHQYHQQQSQHFRCLVLRQSPHYLAQQTLVLLVVIALLSMLGHVRDRRRQ